MRRLEHGAAVLELAERTPQPALARYVRQLQGYVERAPGVVRRREYPGLQVVVILELEPKLKVYAGGQELRHKSFAGGFVAGISSAYTLTEHAGYQAGVQLNLHPLGARRLFGLPLHELHHGEVAFRDLVRPHERDLTQRLAELPTWEARFDALESFLLARLRDADEENRFVAWALTRIANCRGEIRPDQLARELGYSQKHLIALFHEHIGVPPKLWLRLTRFERLQHELRQGSYQSLAQLAVTCGYYDQSHLAREVKAFTGAAATELRRELQQG